MSFIRARGVSPATAGLVARDAQVSGMGSRMNLRRSLESIGSLLRRSSSACTATDASNTCEKPVGPSTSTLAIVLGIM
ncbi:hypothetical protein TGAMA5MH_06923 [Trichoderma gamsii]|uniref:Uncharacterized protein n=1 Tax=Trichoderma gamsii TaxID=398673 RepID=A0A2K0T6A6_9HYPO|nr:hypothetical protein TGAMA5MH_06923 [Trichoderma gamsii]